MICSSKPFILASLLFLCGFSACKHSGQNSVYADNPNWFHAYYQYDNDAYYLFFSNFLQSEEAKSTPFYTQIIQFYSKNQHSPFWTANGYQDTMIEQGIQLFDDAFKTAGIPANYLDLQKIKALSDTIHTVKIAEAAQLYAFLAQLEWQLTNSAIRYANALQFGATDPEIVNGGKWLYPTLKADTNCVNHTLASLKNLPALINSIAPTQTDYLLLQKELRKYIALKDTIFTKIDKKELSKGTKSSQIQLIVKRLRMTGELTSLFQDSTLSPALLTAINLFRVNNAIPESDKLDIETIEALNRDFDYYIDRIIANMERLRWKVEKPKGSNYVAVNFADFTLKTILADTLAIRMKVCCGRPRPENEKTYTDAKGMIVGYKSESPMLRGSMHQLVLFPEWNVPASITKDEYYYKLVKNCQGFLEREKMYIVDSKRREINPATIDWAKVPRNNIPYQLVQTSGYYNSLGIIKFNFNNSESVYLHDTPTKKAFNYRNRGVSHGCIRVEKPLELAKLVLQYNDYNEDQINNVMVDLWQPATTVKAKKYLEEKLEKEEKYKASLPEGKPYHKYRTNPLALKKQLPIFLEYYTCFIGDKNSVQYRNDVYSKDKNILKILHKQ